MDRSAFADPEACAARKSRSAEPSTSSSNVSSESPPARPECIIEMGARLPNRLERHLRPDDGVILRPGGRCGDGAEFADRPAYRRQPVARAWRAATLGHQAARAIPDRAVPAGRDPTAPFQGGGARGTEMRIYEGSPRQNYEEVMRSIGAFLDQRGMREMLVVEAPDGFIVQGLVVETASAGTWSEQIGHQTKDTFTFLDDDIARFLEEGHARRDNGPHAVTWGEAGYYEHAFRVIGRYVDEQKPRDIFFFEQDGAFVLRLLMGTQTGSRHLIAEFTRDEVEAMIAQAPDFRGEQAKPQP